MVKDPNWLWLAKMSLIGVFLGGLVCFGYNTLVSCSVFGACVLSSSVITGAKEVCS